MKKKLSIMLCFVALAGALLFGFEANALNSNVWTKEFYMDVFGDPTEESYFTNRDSFIGTYNSPLVDKAPLLVDFFVDDDNIYFILYEDGQAKLKNQNKDPVEYSIAIKTSEGEKFSAAGKMDGESDRLVIDKEFTEPIRNALLAGNGQVSFYVENNSQHLTNYLFAVDCGNLNELIAEDIYVVALHLLESEDKNERYDGVALLLELGDYKDCQSLCEKMFKQYGSLVGIAYDYDMGIGVPQDYGKAFEWYMRATEADDIGEQCNAFFNIGIYYANGYGVAVDKEKSMEYYLEAVDTGGPDAKNAMFNIGCAYLNGDGVDINKEEAMEWFLKAADLGCETAINNIGMLYSNGEGGEQNYEKAMEWFLKGADLGNAKAIYNIGIMYRDGKGVEQDYEQAMEWFLKGADLNNPGSMSNIAYLYGNGLGVEQSYEKAMEWYLKAADHGDVYAMNNIGVCYAKGLGVEQDYEQAMEWYLKAADSGFEQAREDYNRLKELIK